MIGIGTLVFIFWLFLTKKEMDDRDFPDCDQICAEPGVGSFWAVMFLMVGLLPIGLIVGGVIFIVLAGRYPSDQEVFGYFHGCGYYSFFNPINPGGRALYICLGCILLFACCLPACGLTGPQRRERARLYAGGDMYDVGGDFNASALVSGIRRAQERDATTAAPAAGGARTSRSSNVASAVRYSAQTSAHNARLAVSLAARPVRLARAVSASRLSARVSRVPCTPAPPGRIPVVQATALPEARVRHSGWMIKVLPFWVADSQRRFFVLYDDLTLSFYDREPTSPGASAGAASLLGRVDLSQSLAQRGRRLTQRKFPDSAESYVFTLHVSGRQVDWDLDPGTREAWQAWMDAFAGAGIESGSGLGGGGGSEGTPTPVISATVVTPDVRM